MAEVDPNGELQVSEGGEGLVVRVPLAETSGPWLRQYLGLAREAQIAAEAREEPGRVLLVVRVSRSCSEAQVSEVLDTALELVDKAKVAAEGRDTGNGAIQAHVEAWWARQRPSAVL
jgi:hypothetical protein